MSAVERTRPRVGPKIVALTHSCECQGRVLPEGAQGAIVHEYRDGITYEVEFTQPFPCVVTLHSADIRPV